MSSRYDAIIIGGGHNGLVNAAYLARGGKKVLVLERRYVLGGAAVTEEVFPGFKISVCSYVVSLLRPEIIRELDLPRHGLEILPLDGTFTPMPNGDYLWRVNDHAKTRREIARHSRLDAEAYEEYGQAMGKMAKFVKPILGMTPPDPTRLSLPELSKLLFLGRRFQSLPEADKCNQVHLMTMSAADFLDQWFETDVLKATMSASGIIGTFLGVRSPGTAYVLLHHYMGEIDGAFRSWGFSRGGTGAVSNAIAGAAREAGVEIRTNSGAARILVKGGKAAGVVKALRAVAVSGRRRGVDQRLLVDDAPAPQRDRGVEVGRDDQVGVGFGRRGVGAEVEHRLDLAAKPVEPVGQPVHRDDLEELALGDVAPFLVVAETVDDDDVSAAGFVERPGQH